ncbi:MAG: hypothetical protein NWF14_00685 [Candidatus Bathyarchaeota archaeon]|nr:hypothetical protein [Candidatus Bathyarchaeota archaeon]
MSEQKTSVWLILVSLLMLFVSGAWTLVSILPFGIFKAVRSFMLITVTTANISFLITLLAAMLLYSDVGERENLKKIMIFAFSIGIFALIVSIVLFSASFLITPPTYYPD